MRCLIQALRERQFPGFPTTVEPAPKALFLLFKPANRRSTNLLACLRLPGYILAEEEPKIPKTKALLHRLGRHIRGLLPIPDNPGRQVNHYNHHNDARHPEPK
jgi:hypothetical protein